MRKKTLEINSSASLKAQSSKLKAVVIYHGNCPDGFGAAYAAWKKFKNKADYIPQEHHTPPPADLAGKDIYLLDFCFPEEAMTYIASKSKSLTVIDHHVTAQSLVESIPHHSFAIDQSGAVLAWKYFHPGKTIPKLLLYVQDVDLWKFNLKESPEIASALSVYSMDFKTWDKLAKDLEKAELRKRIVGEGRAILNFKNRIIKEMVEGAEEAEFEGYRTLIANSPTTIHSELGNALVKKMPPLGIVYRRKGDSLKVSLRSDGTVDVAKIAQKYGGGGHKAAAGFQIKISEPYPWKVRS